MLSIPVLVHMRNMRPECLMIRAVLYIHSPKGICALGQRKSPIFFVIPLFSLDPVKPFQGSRDESGIQATVCKVQATQIKKESKPCCICCWFCGGKQGSLCNPWVTYSMLQHIAWKAAWATREENIPERALILEDFQEQRRWTASRGKEWLKKRLQLNLSEEIHSLLKER